MVCSNHGLLLRHHQGWYLGHRLMWGNAHNFLYRWPLDCHNTPARNDMNTATLYYTNQRSSHLHKRKNPPFLYRSHRWHHYICFPNHRPTYYNYLHHHTAYNSYMSWCHSHTSHIHTRKHLLMYSIRNHCIRCPLDNMVWHVQEQHCMPISMRPIKIFRSYSISSRFSQMKNHQFSQVVRRLRTILRIVSCICIFHEPS